MSNSCVDVVRKRDTEHFLASLLLPKSIRNLALAIRALNVELTSVRDAVRDTNTGLIRLEDFFIIIGSLLVHILSHVEYVCAVAHNLSIHFSRTCVATGHSCERT